MDPDGWCINQTEDLGDGASYTARASSAVSLNTNGQLLVQRKIVSTGTVNGIKRRVLLTTNAATGAPLFPANYAAVSLSSVDYGNSVFINGGVGSNGNITLRNTAEVCGAATPGPGQDADPANSATVCPGYPTSPATTNFVLAPVDQGTSATQNDNTRICAADTCTGGVAWNATTRTLTLTNDAHPDAERQRLQLLQGGAAQHVPAADRCPLDAAADLLRHARGMRRAVGQLRAAEPQPEQRHRQPEHRPDHAPDHGRRQRLASRARSSSTTPATRRSTSS